MFILLPWRNDYSPESTDREAVIGVLGLGYVGLPLATAFAAAGFKTIGFDPHRKTVELSARRRFAYWRCARIHCQEISKRRHV